MTNDLPPELQAVEQRLAAQSVLRAPAPLRQRIMAARQQRTTKNTLLEWGAVAAGMLLTFNLVAVVAWAERPADVGNLSPDEFEKRVQAAQAVLPDHPIHDVRRQVILSALTNNFTAQPQQILQ